MRTLTVPNEYCSGTCPNEIEVAGRASSTNVADMHDVSGDAVCFRWLSRTVCWVCVWSTALAQQQGSWSRWKTRWVPFHCTSATADLVKSVKDKVSAVPLYQHNSRPCGVHERWGERQTLWSPWKMGWETQTLWSRWKTRWVPFHCTSTTADFVESLNDEGVYSFISLHWQCHFFACILGSMNDIDKVDISFALYWHCTFTAGLVESMNDKVGSSFSVYWCYSWPCWVHEWQGG